MEAKDLQDKNVDPLTATIAAAADTSDAVLLFGCTAIGFTTPATLTGATFTFLGDMGDGTFVTVKDQLNATVTFIVSVDSGYALDATVFAPYDQIKVVAADGNEAAERLITIKPFAL